MSRQAGVAVIGEFDVVVSVDEVEVVAVEGIVVVVNVVVCVDNADVVVAGVVIVVVEVVVVVVVDVVVVVVVVVAVVVVVVIFATGSLQVVVVLSKLFGKSHSFVRGLNQSLSSGHPSPSVSPKAQHPVVDVLVSFPSQ